MNNVVRYEPGTSAPRVWIELMEPAARLAEAVARTEFVPSGLRGNVPAIAAAILYGDEVGLSPMQSLSKVHVIDGRPALSAEAQRALILAAGHEMWIAESSNTRVTWCGRRAGSAQESKVTWTLDDAKKAGLDGRQNWRRYPRAMLSARASAELARAMFADVIGGLGAVEEFEDGDVPDSPMLEAATAEVAAEPEKKRTAKRPGKTAAKPAAAKTRPPVSASAVLPALPGAAPEPPAVAESAEEPVEGPSSSSAPASSGPPPDRSDDDRQRAQRIAMWCADAGIETDEDRHRFLLAWSEGAISSSYDVPIDDLGQLRGLLKRVAAGEVVVIDDGDGPVLVKTSDRLVTSKTTPVPEDEEPF